MPELYIALEGKVGVGFSVMGGGLKHSHTVESSKQYRLTKYFKRKFVILDYYTLCNKKSEFIFIVMKPVKCYALSRKFMLKKIESKYPKEME